MPRVISEVLAKQDAQVLQELGAMGTPQTQHSTVTGVVVEDGAAATCIFSW